ncbi:MAG: T9SS type A sorting domain-containing protein, partial [Bacteroidia bacterium]
SGCSSTAQISIAVLPLPTVTTSGNTAICAGGSATITATGGTMYDWSSGDTTAAAVVSPAVTTTYLVDVTDSNGCTVSDSLTVTVNALPVVTITGSPVVCTGSPFTLTASAGSSYLWNTGATSSSITDTITANQTYIVAVTDSNGCAGEDTLDVTVNSLPSVVVSGDTSLCQGGSATLVASGASTYIWLPNNQTTASVTVTPSQTSTYTVTGTDANGCSNTITILVAVNQLPNVQLISSTNTACLADGPITFNTVPATGGSLSGPGVTGNQFTPATAGIGTHTVTFSYTDANGCSNTATQQIVVSACVGIQENASASLLVYPNPANTQLFVETTSSGMNTIRIYDSRGRIVMTATSNTTRTELNVETLGTGIYLLEVMSEDGKRSTQNVMIQQ